jgi:multiple sugar transport system permease protein
VSAADARAQGERRLALLLCGPALAVMGIVTAYPLLHAVWLSLYSQRLTDPAGRRFVGLRNYATVLGDPLWWSDVATTSLLAVGTVAIEVVCGLALALLLHRMQAGRQIVRTAVLIPYGIVTVVASFAWQYAFALDTGFVNGWLGLGEFAWFSQRGSALAVIGLAEIWKTTPFVSLLLLAGLAQVPRDLEEAARVDGATAAQVLWRVTLPCMKGALLVAVLFRTLDALRIFDTIFVMTGGAQQTESVAFLAYRQMIQRTALGLGSAVSVLLFAQMIAVAAVFLRGFRVDLTPVRGGR